jgi:hypothetical protein
MKFSTGTVVLSILLLVSLLINFWCYPQVREMFGQKSTIISFPTVLQSPLPNSDNLNCPKIIDSLPQPVDQNKSCNNSPIIPPQDILLQDMLSDNNSDETLKLNIDSNYAIYPHNTQAVATLDSPQPITANQYLPKPNNNITPNYTNTKISHQPAAKQNRLISTIDSTLERPVIYD